MGSENLGITISPKGKFIVTSFSANGLHKKIKGRAISALCRISHYPLVCRVCSFFYNSDWYAPYLWSNKSNNIRDCRLIEHTDIQAKKVHVGDIDIAYKTFGKGNHILLISGSGNVMDVWPTHFLKELASNHTVIIFDNRGVGNTTVGTSPFSIGQFANDPDGLLDALDIQRIDVLGFSMASFID
jgi:hypothetical protein